MLNMLGFFVYAVLVVAPFVLIPMWGRKQWRGWRNPVVLGYARMMGKWRKGPQDNSWVFVPAYIIIVFTAGFMMFGISDKPLGAALYPLIQWWGSAGSEVGISKLESLAILINGGESLSSGAQQLVQKVADTPSSPPSNPTFLWLIAAAASWFVGILWIAYIYADNVGAGLAAIFLFWSRKKDSAGTATSGTQGSNPTSSTTRVSSFNIADDIIGGVIAEQVNKWGEKWFSKIFRKIPFLNRMFKTS